MELKDIIVVLDGEPRAGTWLIAQGFDREHNEVLKLIKRYSEKFKNFSALKTRKYKSTGGRPVVEYLLNEPQATFLGTLFKNNEQVVDFKAKLIKEFYRMREAILKAKARQVDTGWIETRKDGKQIRVEATDVIKEFKEYAIKQGSKNADMYYCNITKMINSLLFIVNGKYKNLRDLMSSRQLMITGAVDGIVDKGLKDGMRRNMFYKEIYKLVKKRVEIFADLHGQSEIILQCSLQDV